MPIGTAGLIEVLIEAITKAISVYVNSPGPESQPKPPTRIPVAGERWRIMAVPNVAAVIVKVENNSVSYHFEKTPDMVNVKPLDYFMGLYTHE